MDLSAFLAVVPYRCVCGNAIALLNNDARSCLVCGRAVPTSAFDRGDATIIGGSEPPEMKPEEFDPILRQRFRHFRVLGRLGQGGMGAVYRAVDESLERDVALKVIRTSKNNQSEKQMMQRLLQEARAQARVTHPNVVQVYFVDAEAEIPFLAMELVPGITLEDRLQAGTMEFLEIIDVAIQATKALKAAAQYHIVHGDIKPANLLMSTEGTLKLSDFGLARSVDQMAQEPTGIAGTPNYLSPEACRGATTDHRSDMYSLGILLFQCTFGRLPYSTAGEPLMARLRAHMESPVDYPQTWPSEIPIEWKEVLDTLLAKNPADRYPDYNTLGEALERLRPMELPIAGRLVRGFAWAIDLAVVFLLIQFFRDFAKESLLLENSATADLATVGFSVVALLLIAKLQSMTGSSPGKQLMQIRQVDEHGLRVGGLNLFQRAFFQLMPVWASVALRGFVAIGMPMAGWIAGAVLGAISLADALCAVFRPDRRSLHDLLIRTYVVLDTTLHKRSGKFVRPRRRRRADEDSRDLTVQTLKEASTQSASWTSRAR